MKAAVVFDLAEGPVWADFIDPQPAPGQTIIDVRAAALSHVVKARASGRHYSFDGNLPFVPGIDGVGTTPQGQRVYFAFPTAPFGSMAQQAPVALQSCLPVPDALDDVSAAAMANPGMSAWASLVTRAQIQAGETVLINGATGSAGQLAVQIARYLGAKKIIAKRKPSVSLPLRLFAGMRRRRKHWLHFQRPALRRLTWSSITCGDTARKCYCRPWRNIPQPADRCAMCRWGPWLAPISR